MSEWRTIETVPMDGTLVDLWMVDQDGGAWRETDAYYVRDREERFYEVDAAGVPRAVVRRRDGWWAPNHDYDGADGFCDEPRRFNECERFSEPTHWMPIPAPPLPVQETKE